MQDNHYYEQKADSNRFAAGEYYIDYDSPYHFHRNIEMMYVRKKSYTVTVSEQTVHVKKDEIIVIPSYTSHGAETQAEVKCVLLLFPYNYLSLFPAFQTSSENPFILSDKKFNRTKILPILQLLLSSIETDGSRHPALDILMQSWTNLIFGTIFSFYNHKIQRQNLLKKDVQNADFSEQILSYIDKNYMQPDLTLETIAQTFRYNPSYLSRSFKQLFSVSISQYIRSVRIQKFIALYPMQKQTNILNLAMQCGFSSASAFYRAFTEQTNTSSPSEYFLNKESPAYGAQTETVANRN